MADPTPAAPPGVYGLLAALSQNGLLPPRQRTERPPTRDDTYFINWVMGGNMKAHDGMACFVIRG